MSIVDYADEFFKLKIKEYDPTQKLTDPESFALRLSLSWEEVEDQELKFRDKFESFINDPSSERVPALVIGPWSDEWDGDSVEILELLIDNKDKLKSLKALFVGDITYEDCEISWIQQGDYEDLLKAYPNLEELRIRGEAGLGRRGHDKLKTLIIETGGLSTKCLEEISSSAFPNLTHLELWLGDENYGFDGTIDTIKRFVTSLDLPHLTYLGLKNSEIADEIAACLANHDIIDQLEVLDLSLGTLTDKGGQALFDSDKVRSLKQLILRFHYMSDAMCKKLESMEIECDCADVQQPDEYDDEIYRSVFVSE